jgi:hypothetical protein
MNKTKFISITITLIVLSGCSTLRTAVAMMQSTDHFALLSDKNALVYQENTPSPLAADAEKYLTKAMDVVEKEHYRKFVKPVRIYAISKLRDVKRYCGYKNVLGCVVNEKIFLSPRILTQPAGMLPRLLTHELSHLQITQQLSLIAIADLPTWFKEGLAVYVSTKNEASAGLDFSEAKALIQEGKSFHPNKTESLLFPKNNKSFHLSRRMFYRQAASFVRFLHDTDATAFKNLLLGIQDAQPFSSSFEKYYGATIDAECKAFVNQG